MMPCDDNSHGSNAGSQNIQMMPCNDNSQNKVAMMMMTMMTIGLLCALMRGSQILVILNFLVFAYKGGWPDLTTDSAQYY